MGSENGGIEDLFLEGDDGLMLVAEMDDAPPRPSKDYLACPLAWLAKVRPVAPRGDQFLVLLLLYRKCLMARHRTVSLSNRDLQPFGISRYAKYRILVWLQASKVLSIETRNGRPIEVTLHWFP